MTRDERIQYCKVCSNRKFSMEQGTICGLTGEKPVFETQCENYAEDHTAIEDEKKRKEDVEKSVDISGFLAFFVYWSIPISIAATLISHLVNWRETAALGTFGVLFEIAFLAFYCYFEIYTIYGFVKRKPDAVFIAKYQLIILVVVNLFTVLIGAADEGSFLSNTPRLIMSVAWCAIFFVYLCMSEDVEALIPKKTRKLSGRNKVLVILSLVIPVLLFIGAIFEGAIKTYGVTALSSPEQQVEAACKAKNTELPSEVSEGVEWTSMSVKNKELVLSYTFNEETSYQYEDVSDDYVKLLSLYQKELGKAGIARMTYDDDPLFGLCSKAGYPIRYVYYTASGQEVISYSFDKEEYDELLSKDFTYSTSEEDFSNILDVFNSLMPIDYFEGCKLNECQLLDSGEGLRYKLELTDMDMSTLSGLSGKYIKDYMLSIMPYLTDAPFVLAVSNNKEIVYDFTADCSSWWKTSVRIKPEEYNAIMTEE